MRVSSPLLVALALLRTPAPGIAQASTSAASGLLDPASAAEVRLARDPFEIVAMADNRWDGDRTKRTALRFRDGTVVGVKWARAAPGGSALNNEPRYELAAYRFQKLFLAPSDWVVPATVVRAVPLRVYQELDGTATPTFQDTRSVLVVVQAWVDSLQVLARPDSARLAREPAYARRLGQLSLFTYLIHHTDSNTGNVLIAPGGDPHMYSVDNGVAFRSPESPRGTLWKDLLVDRVPADAVRRLRALRPRDLIDALAVVAEFEVERDGSLRPIEFTAPLNPRDGVRRLDRTIQFGLNAPEISDIWTRIQDLLRRVDAGEIGTY